jgi:hypothetical protein
MSQTQVQKSSILWNRKSVQSAMLKKGTFTEAQAKAGKKVSLTIRGNGNWVDVKKKDGSLVGTAANPEEVLRKKIFNVKAVSEVAMLNPRNKALVTAATIAEKAGKAQEAADNYNAFLNATEISFSVLANHKLVDKLGNNVDISAKLELIETENGKIITIDASTIAIMEPESAQKTTFSLDEFFSSEEAEAATDTVPASELDALSV